MITVLKGTPQYSIDSSGLISISTTWMLIPDSSTNSIVGWLEFENSVSAWAGDVGDKYKMPKPTTGREIYEFEETDAFLVSDISYSCVEGRTHYEVSFTNVQNLKVMYMVGNVSAQIDSNNEKTKSVSYLLDVSSSDPLAIDAHFLSSGTQVSWAGVDYKIAESSYEAQSKTRYSLNISAKDMSVMKIGNTQFASSNLGQKTASASWRYSKEAYETWVQPLEGDDASIYLGLPENSGYLISNISAEPNGVLGYTVNISAEHVSKRHVTTSYKEYTQGNIICSSSTIRYKSDKESLPDFSGKVSNDATEYGRAGERVTDVSVDESSRNNFDVTITTSNDTSIETHDSNDPEAVGISMSLSELALEARQCGWTSGLSGELHQINMPPQTKFTYTTTPDALINQSADAGVSGYNVTSNDILNTIVNGGTIGFDRIVGVQVEKDDNLVWLTPSQQKKLNSLDKVQSIKLEGFVYAQPSMKVGGTVLRSLLFEPWKASESCPITFKSGWQTIDGRDAALKKDYINYKFKICEFSVDIAYKGNIVTTLRKNIGVYFGNAIKHIRSENFTSYKGTSFSMNESTDATGVVWTRVTCGIQALMQINKGKPIWNSKYDNSYVEY